MYIQPNTNIRLLKNVPIDNTYNNTIYFSNKGEQTNYFLGKTKINYTGQSYQRAERGYMQIERKAEDLYDCNYMMFQNESFGSKWFYAFILGVQYVNNITCRVIYQIDIMQTWFFDFTFKECFVEREHTKTDEIGDNIVAEEVACGEYVFGNYGVLDHVDENINIDLRDMSVIISVVDTEGETSSGKMYDGVYGGCTLFRYDQYDVEKINAKISEYIQSPESIVSVYLCPTAIINDSSISGGEGSEVYEEIRGGSKCEELTFRLESISGNEKFGNYTPKNKKLYTYPYNYLSVDNGSGNNMILRYEFFKDLTPYIVVNGVMTQPVKLVARPFNYKGILSDGVGGTQPLFTESISLECYPTCSWNCDTYKAWLAQNSVPILLKTATTAVDIGVGLNIAKSRTSLIGGSADRGDINAWLRGDSDTLPKKASDILYDNSRMRAEATSFDSFGGILSSCYSASVQADMCRGNTSNSNVNVANGDQNFYSGRVHVTEEFAKIIDDYFTRYGYAVNRVKTPSINNRPKWTFIKTRGCNIIGEMPADDMQDICSIMDRGITFWRNGDEVGNYSLNNSAYDETPDLH